MIGRRVLFLDRLVALVIGVALLAAAAAGVWWWSGTEMLPARTDLGVVTDTVAKPWWPWVSAAVGTVLILIALRWMLAHVSRRRVSTMTLPGTSGEGRLTIDAANAVDAAAEAFADIIGVHSAKGFVTRDRGQVVARIMAKAEPDVDLGRLAQHADHVSSQLGRALGREDVRCSVELRVSAVKRSRASL